MLTSIKKRTVSDFHLVSNYTHFLSCSSLHGSLVPSSEGTRHTHFTPKIHVTEGLSPAPTLRLNTNYMLFSLLAQAY